MAGQSIALSTKGIICRGGDITRIIRFILPFNLRLKTDLFKLNLKKEVTINLNSFIDQKKLNLIRLSQFKLNSKLSEQFKLNLKKCEDS